MHATENVVSMSFQFSKDSKLTLEIQFKHGEGFLAKCEKSFQTEKKLFEILISDIELLLMF